MKFTYGSGERVLEGYTLKRGVGRGGFGEVFYAVSDGGKEVALKLVRGSNLDVELRGMAQCLNLKHPNLLTLYDIRTDGHGDHWIIMEYISGEALSAAIERHPQGLPRDLVQQWFAELARGVACLHSHGIVHRDLKPGNVFLENGTVKVGDYGLSKFISSSQHTAQTQSIGTVHYMAPEISTGNYNKQIDIYASGVILYEMLSGRVPFDGESAGEILMKHLTSPPDLSKIPSEYVGIVGKALAKNPAQRYQSMVELAQAVEGIGSEPVAKVAASSPGTNHFATSPPPVAQPVGMVPPPLPASPVTIRSQIAELCGSLVMATLFSALACTIWAALGRIDQMSTVGSGFFLTVAACWAVLIPAKIWDGREGDSGVRRVVMMLLGILVGAGALWLDHGRTGFGSTSWTIGGPSPAGRPGVIPHPQGIPVAAGYLSYFGLAFFALKWWKMAERQRPQRFSFGPVLAAGFWAFVLLLLFVGTLPEAPQGMLPLLITSAVVQIVSPWQQSPPPITKRMRLRYT